MTRAAFALRAPSRQALNRLARSIPLPAAIALSTLSVIAAAAQPAPVRTPIDLSKLGPQVGEQVPEFTLRDQTGTAWTRQSIMGRRGAMLVFIRSADW
jgi:hypothetical protein